MDKHAWRRLWTFVLRKDLAMSFWGKTIDTRYDFRAFDPKHIWDWGLVTIGKGTEIDFGETNGIYSIDFADKVCDDCRRHSIACQLVTAFRWGFAQRLDAAQFKGVGECSCVAFCGSAAHR